MSQSSTNWQGVTLKPLDVLFFRDGRPFDAANRVAGGLPTPQTLTGALRTAMLSKTDFDFAKFAKLRKSMNDVKKALEESGAPSCIINAKFRGPWLAKKIEDGKSLEVYLPTPPILTRDKDDKTKWYRKSLRDAKDIPGWDGQSSMALWSEAKPGNSETPGGFLTLAGIQQVLDGGIPDHEQHVSAVDLFDYDQRTGIGIDGETLTSAEGEIYGIRFLVLKKDICLYAEISPGEGDKLSTDHHDWLPTMFPFGGEGKYVQTSMEDSPVKWPKASDNSQDSLLLLATPAFVNPNELWPTGLADAKVMAGASDHAIAVSGWDIARNGPKATRFAVPAGSVYFVEGDFTPNNTSLCTDDEDVAQGWGFALRGIWKR